MEEITPSLTLHLGHLPFINRENLELELERFQDLFFDECGVIVPTIKIAEDRSLPENMFQVEINGVKQPPIESLAENEFWVFYPASQIENPFLDHAWEFRPSIEPNTGEEAAIIVGGQDEQQIWRENGYDIRTCQGYVIFSTAAQIRSHKPDFVVPGLVRFYLSRLRENYPALIETVREVIPETTLIEALKSRLADNESIKDMPRLLEELLARQILSPT